MRSGGIRNLKSDFGSAILSFCGKEISFVCQKSAQGEGHTANDKCVYSTWMCLCTGKRVVGDDGEEGLNDMYHENQMLTKETQNHRTRIKAMQVSSQGSRDF
jgi:hypothetical protein